MAAFALPRRPRVPVWLRPLARRTGEVQFGVLAGGPIVGGASSDEVRLLCGLDGTVPLEATYERARSAGVSRGRWRELLTLTTRLGVLVDADERPHVARPGGRLTAVVPTPYAVPLRVVVDGSGPVAAEIAAAAGCCSSVAVVHDPAEVDRVIADPAAQRPDLVVLVGSPLVDPRRGNLWLRHGIPHLPVATAGPRTTVGPLVEAAAAAPCLWCLDRHRADRDGAWPTVLAQATPDPGPAGRPGHSRVSPASDLPVATAEGLHEGLSPGLGRLVAGTVALLVSRLAEGQLPPRGVSVDLSLPWPRMDHRRWDPHPLCPAHPSARPGPT